MRSCANPWDLAFETSCPFCFLRNPTKAINHAGKSCNKKELLAARQPKGFMRGGCWNEDRSRQREVRFVAQVSFSHGSAARRGVSKTQDEWFERRLSDGSKTEFSLFFPSLPQNPAVVYMSGESSYSSRRLNRASRLATLRSILSCEECRAIAAVTVSFAS